MRQCFFFINMNELGIETMNHNLVIITQEATWWTPPPLPRRAEYKPLQIPSM